MDRWIDTLPRFQAALAAPDTPPEDLALLVGDLLQPGLDLEPYHQRLDILAGQVARRLTPGRTGRPVAESLIAAIYHDLGYQGNQGHYYDPLNSFLHRVLERRTGLPITLGVIYLAVGRRLGLELIPLGLPGHFMVGYPAPDGFWLLDAFHGQVVEEGEVGAYLGKIFGQAIALHRPLSLYRLSSRETVARILNNLRATYLSHRNLHQARAVLSYLLAAAPERPEYLRERGLIDYRLGLLSQAQQDLIAYFVRRGRSHLLWARNTPGPGALPEGPVPDHQTWSASATTTLRPSEDEAALLDVLDEIRLTLARQN